MREERGAVNNKERINAYISSRLYPWNFIIEEVDSVSLRRYIPYAIQICEDKGISRGKLDPAGARDVIEREVKRVLNEYLHPAGRDVMRMHHRDVDYPFAFAQALIYSILYRSGLSLEDVMNMKALSELLELDMKELKRREQFIFDLIARNEGKAMWIFSRSLLERRVMSEEGDYIGTVADILFDPETGVIEWLLLNQQSGRVKVPADDMKLNLYSRNIVLKYDRER